MICPEGWFSKSLASDEERSSRMRGLKGFHRLCCRFGASLRSHYLTGILRLRAVSRAHHGILITVILRG